MDKINTKLSAIDIILTAIIFSGVPGILRPFIAPYHEHYETTFRFRFSETIFVIMTLIGIFILVKYLLKHRSLKDHERKLLGLIVVWIMAWAVVSSLFELVESFLNIKFSSFEFSNTYIDRVLKFLIASPDNFGGFFLGFVIVGQYIIRFPISVLLFLDASLNWYLHLIFFSSDDIELFWKTWKFSSMKAKSKQTKQKLEELPRDNFIESLHSHNWYSTNIFIKLIILIAALILFVDFGINL